MLLGSKYVHSERLSDVTFIVDGKPFYAHRIALLAARCALRSSCGWCAPAAGLPAALPRGACGRVLFAEAASLPSPHSAVPNWLLLPLLLCCSEIFQSMFDGHYREKSANTIPIPNIKYEVFEAMMHCIYTGRC